MESAAITKAIKIGIRFVKPWEDKMRCYGIKMGYGEFVDLTLEEYEIYQAVSNLTVEEQLARLKRR